MARRTRAMLFVAASAGALVACNLLAGLTEDYALNPEAGVPGGEAGNDAMGDGMIGQDGPNADNLVPPNEGGMDTSAGFDAQAFCETADSGTNSYGFCDDFEQDPSMMPPLGTSSFMYEQDASILVLDDAGFGHSKGLTVFMDQKTGPTNTAWAVFTLNHVSVPNLFHHYEVDFDFRIDSVSTVYSSNVGELTFPSGPPPQEFGVGQYSTGSKLGRLNNDIGNQVTATHNWQHAHIEIDRPDGGSTFTETTWIDKAISVVEGQVNINPSTDGATEIRLGIFSTSNNVGKVRVSFDQVVARRW